MRGPKTSLDLITITTTSDGMGGWTTSEENTATLSGVLITLSGEERFASDMITVIQTHRFYCDYDSRITEDDQFKEGSQYYDIISINNPGQYDIYQQIDIKERK